MSKDPVIDPAEQKRVGVFEAKVGVLGHIKFAVNGDGDILFAHLEGLTIGAHNKDDKKVHDWAEANAPVIGAWLAKLIVAGIEESKKNYDNRGVITPKVPVKG